MIKNLSLLVLLTSFLSCNFPTELPIPDNAKSADNFSRAFIDKIVAGQPDSTFNDIAPEVLDDKAKDFIYNSSRNINGARPKKYTVVEVNWTSGVFTDSKSVAFTRYRLGYEYEFEKGNILFTTTIKEQDGKFSVLSFNGEFLPAPLSVLTKFTLTGKTVLHYVFLVLCIFVPLFVLTSLVVMVLSKMTFKKKIIWALMILLFSLPRFTIDWGNGQLDFSLFNINLGGSGFSKPTLYSAWLLSFNIPLGAIIFWIKRKELLIETSQLDNETIEVSNVTNEE